jgi:hypothetical protein
LSADRKTGATFRVALAGPKGLAQGNNGHRVFFEQQVKPAKNEGQGTPRQTEAAAREREQQFAQPSSLRSATQSADNQRTPAL